MNFPEPMMQKMFFSGGKIPANILGGDEGMMLAPGEFIVKPQPEMSSEQLLALLGVSPHRLDELMMWAGVQMPEDVIEEDGAKVRATIAERLAVAQKSTGHVYDEPGGDSMKWRPEGELAPECSPA